MEEAQRAINAAHVEAESVQNGIGLVKLMGRYSGELVFSISIVAEFRLLILEVRIWVRLIPLHT